MENLGFNPKTAEEEYKLIANDDNNFTETKRYLEPLVSQVINRCQPSSEETRQKLTRDLIFIDIPLAVKRFLSNKENLEKNIKFSTYFTWYIEQRLNQKISWHLKLWKKIKAIFR